MKSVYLNFLVQFILLLCFNYSQASESFVFKQIGTQEGLSQNTVRSILVDKKGFVWAGTLDGINRFDGSRFITYKPGFGKAVNLTDHRIRSIFESKNGLLWLRKYDNTFSCYDPQTESLIEVNRGDKIIPLNFTNYMEASDSSVWLWDSRNGCIKIKKQGCNLQAVFYAPPASGLLSGGGVEMVFEDSRRNIWIGCVNGLNLAAGNRVQGKFYTKKPAIHFRKAIEVNHIIYFISEQDYICRYDLNNHKFLPELRTPQTYYFTDIAKMDDDHLLFSSRNEGLLSFTISTSVFNQNPFSGKNISRAAQLISDSKGGIWIFDHSGVLRRYLSETRGLKDLNLIPSQIASVIDFERYNVFIDSRNVYWITTYGNGLFRYEPQTGLLENYQYSNRENSLPSNYLLAITEDRFGSLWIGSEYAGIIKVVRQRFKVQYFRPEKDNSPGTSNNVKVVFEDSKKNVWVGTKNGSLYLYNQTLASYRCIHKNMNPYTILEDHESRIWIGTKGNGIYVYNLSGDKQLMHFVNEAGSNKSLAHNSVFNIIQDSHKRIWVATFGGGLDLLENNNGKYSFKHFFSNEGNKSYIRYLYEDHTGNIWAGSYAGLMYFHPDKLIASPRNYRLYTYNSNNPEGLNCNDIKTIYEDRRRRLWVGTAGGGLNLLVKGKDKSADRFVKYTTKEGLPSDIVTSIVEGANGELWISTENGITRFDDQQKTFMLYRFSENSNGNYYSENAGTLRRNGDMMWGTLDGLVAFNPSKFIRSKYAPPVIFTDLYIFDQRVRPGEDDSPIPYSITDTKHLELKHYQNTFTLNFSNLDHSEPGMNKYSYIMEPFESSWSLPGNSNAATYKNLPPGDYTFRVKGSNPDGNWNNEESVLHITVHPPFWKSTAAKLIYLIVLLLLVGFAIITLIKITRLNNMVRMEKQLTDYKLRFFTNISHEFRTPLTLIHAAVESLTGMKSMSPEASKHLDLLTRNSKQMSRLIDQLLEFRKIQNNILTLNLEATEITDYIYDIYYNFREISYQKDIDFKLEMITGKWNIYIDRNKVEKIIFNLLSNAFKFTPRRGMVELVIEKGSNDCCRISVKDTGIGIPKEKQSQLFSRFMQIHFSAEGTGVGLALVKEFIEAHKGKVWFEENPGGGSVFIVELPSEGVYKDARYVDDEISKPITAEQQMHAVETEVSALQGNHDLKLLIIDDNKDIRDYLTEELRSHFTIETAEDGRGGLEKAIAGNPDLIICDVKMPGMDGIEVTTRIKDDFQTSHIPVILLTALSSESIQLAGSECGADAYIMKPFSMKFLFSRVYKLIEQREKLKKRFSIDIHVKENILSRSDKDKEFYTLINKIIDDNLSRHDFSVEEFTDLSLQKRTIFYKKVKGLTGYSPNELIKIKRMKKAAELILEGKHTVAEVSWKVGIEDQFYFSKCFKAQFGCSPSKYGSHDGLSRGEKESDLAVDIRGDDE
ncbi:MAG TPA: two-component regulator propeller domain-containing protein [Bacteroidales bacterium]|nr:two-component regulator propeller domain-containing protein [Bacteroidales bacterium]